MKIVRNGDEDTKEKIESMGGYGSKLLSRGTGGNISFPDSDCECDDSDCGTCGDKSGKKDKWTNTQSLVVTKFFCQCRSCDVMKEPFEDLSSNFDDMTFIEAQWLMFEFWTAVKRNSSHLLVTLTRIVIYKLKSPKS